MQHRAPHGFIALLLRVCFLAASRNAPRRARACCSSRHTRAARSTTAGDFLRCTLGRRSPKRTTLSSRREEAGAAWSCGVAACSTLASVRVSSTRPSSFPTERGLDRAGSAPSTQMTPPHASTRSCRGRRRSSSGSRYHASSMMGARPGPGGRHGWRARRGGGVLSRRHSSAGSSGMVESWRTSRVSADRRVSVDRRVSADRWVAWHTPEALVAGRRCRAGAAALPLSWARWSLPA